MAACMGHTMPVGPRQGSITQLKVQCVAAQPATQLAGRIHGPGRQLAAWLDRRRGLLEAHPRLGGLPKPTECSTTADTSVSTSASR